MKQPALTLYVAGMALLLHLSAAADPLPGQVVLGRSVVANGGGEMSNGSYALWGGTAGQPAVGALTGPLYSSKIGFWDKGYSPFLTGVGGPDDLPMTKYSLSQNYPNPFSRTTRLDFSIPKRCHVKITIYDVAGRELRTILDEEVDPGHRSVALDGRGLASGVYFYRMEAGHFVKAKKFMYVR